MNKQQIIAEHYRQQSKEEAQPLAAAGAGVASGGQAPMICVYILYVYI